MPKVKKDRLSTLQESLLLAMDYIETRAGEGGLISGSAIARILGGRWSDHRAKAMEALAGSGWLTVHTMAHDLSKKRYYCLTETARIHLMRRFAVPEGDFIPMDYNLATLDMFGE